MRLKDKVYLITGAAAGIGEACAGEFAAEGAKVIVSDIDRAKGEAVAGGIRASGGQAVFLECDVAEPEAVRNLVAESVAVFGRLDGAIPNAGIVHVCDFLDLTLEDFDRVLNINLRGAFVTAQEVARHLVRQGEGGTIIHMSSVNAVLAIPATTSYAVSKGGIGQLTRGMALALASHGIRVNAIGPGSINTDVLKAVATDKAAMNRILSRTPMGRAGEVSEVARIAVFLASEDSSYITGQTIYADGGRMALNYTVPVRD
ncbi:SDR family NAD(P)-dependent oxidoreductase [Pseudogemmobacter humi]|uniref:Glucose 1-dehydrogenase n=1 Tax=Pseudogemmobacter humi TaxID=2483812 RepID=A0A3P5XBJ1_9RHOB|nr:glucose 1-dehydrogenase [Pseudogemmobacter humi]VDC28663.1 Glucose 1-dehydrogenase [Pseudogemmobacter humi]